MPKLHPATQLALDTLDGSFRGKAWQGPTLSGSLRGVGPAVALWKPAGKRRCIWEQMLHAAYWKLTILRVFQPETGLALLRPGSNWPRSPAPDSHADAERLWAEDVRRLNDIHDVLREAVAALPPSSWHDRPPKPSSGGARSLTYSQYLAGAAAHDAYHTGQIRLLKRLYADR